MTPLPPELELPHHRWFREGQVLLLLHESWTEALPRQALLEGAPLTDWGQPVEHALQGRGELHVLRTPAGEIVAKGYSRGGVIGSLLRHWYADPWRPAREAEVSERLKGLGFLTPTVVAARASRAPTGLYRLEIATARMTGARDLLDVLREARGQPERLEALAVAAGRTLRRLHDVHLHHRDLQVKNLLVPASGQQASTGSESGGSARSDSSARPGELVVLDLDRCAFGDALPIAERVGALARFTRSLVKNGLAAGRKHAVRDGWSSQTTHAFLSAYGPLDGLDHDGLVREVQRRLQKMLRTHELLWDSQAAS